MPSSFRAAETDESLMSIFLLFAAWRNPRPQYHKRHSSSFSSVRRQRLHFQERRCRRRTRLRTHADGGDMYCESAAAKSWEGAVKKAPKKPSRRRSNCHSVV